MKSKIIVISMLLLILISVSAVSAEELNETEPINDYADDITLTENVNENALTDSQPSSFNDLQNTINNAPDESVLYLNEDYKGSEDSIKLHKSLTIDGQGHSLDCDYNARAFESNAGDITLKNIIIKNGDDRMGGAIYIVGSAKYTIINCTFINNKASEGGGAIYNNAADQSLTVINSTFTDSRVQLQKGGAIYSKGPVYVDNSMFENGFATNGGAIYSEKSMDITSSSFISNTAESRDNRDQGGALYAKGILTVENCNFTNNTAVSEHGGAIKGDSAILVKNSFFTNNVAKVGGAIYKGSGDYVAVENSTFIGNKATSYYGGAIHASTNVIVGNCTFISNEADEKGGAIYSDYIEFDGGSRFISNSALDHGGAIYTERIAGTSNDLYFESNQAKSDFGGAIYINKNSGEVIFSNSTFKSNSAIKGDGGAIFSDSGSTTLVLNGCVFSENYADAGVEKRFGGAVCSRGNVRVSNSTFYKNWAENRGGAIYSHKGISISDNSSFIENYVKKEYGGAVFSSDVDYIVNTIFVSNNADRGAAVYSDEINRIENSIFQLNSADLGGAVYCDEINRVYDSAFISNTARDKGGAIYINSKCEPSITKSYFEGNIAANRGGAIYSDSASTNNLMTLNNNAFVNNNAGDQGKHVFNRGKYESIRGNWWGSNSPSFNNEEVMEYKVWGSNKEHSDSDVNTVNVKLDADAYVYETYIAKINFKYDVPEYLLYKIFNETKSRKNVNFTLEKINSTSLEEGYYTEEIGTDYITVMVNSLKFERTVTIDTKSVYATDFVKTFGDSQVYTAIFKDKNDNNLKPGDKAIFSVKIDGQYQNYEHLVGENGTAVFTELSTLAPGSYDITVRNGVTRAVYSRKVTILPRNYTFNMSDALSVTFNNASLENEPIDFKIANKTFKSNVTNGSALFRLDVPAGEYTVGVYHKDELLGNIYNVTVLDQYSLWPLTVDGENYAATVPIYANETFIIMGNYTYSEMGENLRRYIFRDGYGGKSGVLYI